MSHQQLGHGVTCISCTEGIWTLIQAVWIQSSPNQSSKTGLHFFLLSTGNSVYHYISFFLNKSFSNVLKIGGENVQSRSNICV